MLIVQENATSAVANVGDLTQGPFSIVASPNFSPVNGDSAVWSNLRLEPGEDASAVTVQLEMRNTESTICRLNLLTGSSVRLVISLSSLTDGLGSGAFQ